jgi:maltooligosyltrehalose trehalohydrolase
MLFQGEEWGATAPFLYFTDHRDPALGDAVREGRRSEFASFGWDADRIPDPQDVGSFRDSRLDWEEPSRSPHAELLAWHRQLIALRTAEAGAGGLQPLLVHVNEEGRYLVVQAGRLTWAVNLSGAMQRVAATVAIDDLVLANDSAITVEHSKICMPAQSVAIFRSP